ncbi:hypothetical protein LA080_007164 [Diaporthe eres]|nr:hypothetical protein LA080_007164 [Diaporthe eres]
MSTASLYSRSGSGSGSGCGCIHFSELFGWCTWPRSLGITIVSLVALSLSIGTLHPRGPVTLSPLPIPNNWIWYATFSVANVLFTLWSVAGIFRGGIRERLERHPTLRRFFLLIEIALVMAGFIIFFGYMYVGTMSDNGCSTTKIRPGCPAAMTIIVFDCLWCGTQFGQWCYDACKYCRRDRDDEEEDPVIRRERWIRGIQAFAYAYLIGSAPCSSIQDQGCFAVYVDVGFVCAFGVLQLYHVARFWVEYCHCGSILKKAHQEKKDFERQQREAEKRQMEWDDTLDRRVPEEAYIHNAHTTYNERDKRGHGRNHSRKTRPDKQREAAQTRQPEPDSQLPQWAQHSFSPRNKWHEPKQSGTKGKYRAPEESTGQLCFVPKI